MELISTVTLHHCSESFKTTITNHYDVLSQGTQAVRASICPLHTSWKIKRWRLPPPSPLHHCSESWDITSTYKNICFDFLLRCLWYIGLKTKKWATDTCGSTFLGRCSSAPLFFFFLGPGELSKGGTKQVCNYLHYHNATILSKDNATVPQFNSRSLSQYQSTIV